MLAFFTSFISYIADKRRTSHVCNHPPFDPAMCCSTRACGPSVHPELARFAAGGRGLPSRETLAALAGVVVKRRLDFSSTTEAPHAEAAP